LVGVAVNVTDVPEHTGFAEVAIEILTGRFGFTVMVTVFEVAGFPVGQVALEVKTQEAASLFSGTK
jgi:deoxyribose-phosphate aldolase